MKGRRNLSDEGSTAIEAAIVTPCLLLFLLLAIAAGRIVMAGQVVDAASEDAARQASITRSPGEARESALAAARATLSGQGVHCASVDIALDTSGLGTDVGEAGTVTATVTCRVELSDLALPGVPGTRTMTSSFTSTVDQYVER
ncbi:TadE family protein [Streptomyces sp. WMMC940]|uniref:TadE family protein n=1 Tax=Streptomyces sp. WMMC940 TaxID=3015153 RepID=UPI0022B678E0|nr:TadE/TadG family type IV pilus assembly protein [Streptomyces sp. WMMC940]MCZ7458214.1 TadE/TadG family type IV pilus assembly protein [Streptomyces sp. WMMC940]